MKNIYIFILTAMLFNSGAGYTFPDKRFEWWNARLKKIESRIEISKNQGGPYSQIADLLEKEKESAIRILSVLDADKKNNGSLTHQNKIYSDEELSLEADKTLKGIFSIYFLSLYSTEPFNSDNISELKNSAKKDLSSLKNFKSMNESGILAAEAADKRISHAQWKNISFETMLSALKFSNSYIYSSLKKKIIDELKKQIGEKETNSREIENKIYKLSAGHLSKHEMLSCFTINDNALNDSSAWRHIRKTLAGSPGTNDTVIENYKKQSAAYIDYIRYISELIDDAGKAALKSRIIQPEFDNAVVKSSILMNAIAESSIPDIRLLPDVNPEEVRKIREIKKDFSASMNLIKNEISLSYNEYLSEKRSVLKKNNDAGKNLNSKIAHFEIDSILKSAEAYAKYYESINYSEEVISKFISVYNILMNDALRGNVTQELDSVIRNNSILGNIDGFNREKFNSELKLKELIKKDLIAEVKTVNRLIDDYRRSGISLNARPSDEEIKMISAKALKKINAKIGKMILNENNIFETDKTAAKELSSVLNKISWSSSDRNKGISFRIDEIDSEIKLPYGWSENIRENTKGIIREFNDLDGKASISINSITLEDESLKEASDRWAKEKGITLLKSRWDEGSISKYRFFARTKDLHVVDSYAFIKNGKAFIISVKCDKTRYGILRDKLELLVSSLPE